MLSYFAESWLYTSQPHWVMAVWLFQAISHPPTSSNVLVRTGQNVLTDFFFFSEKKCLFTQNKHCDRKGNFGQNDL